MRTVPLGMRHAPGHDRVEHTVQGRRVVVDDPVPDLAIAVHRYLARNWPCQIVGTSGPKA